jgi:dodecin
MPGATARSGDPDHSVDNRAAVGRTTGTVDAVVTLRRYAARGAGRVWIPIPIRAFLTILSEPLRQAGSSVRLCSEKGFDHAVEEALKEAAETIDNIEEIWVSGQKAIVENNKIVEYRVNTKISFVVKGNG